MDLGIDIASLKRGNITLDDVTCECHIGPMVERGENAASEKKRESRDKTLPRIFTAPSL